MLSHPLRAAAGIATAVDPYFRNVTTLLHGDGTNGAQNNTFIDSSANAFTVTRNGNVTQGSYGPYGIASNVWSNYFDGTGDYLLYSGITFTGDFCAECWYYRTTNPSNYTVVFGGTGAGSGNHQFNVFNNGGVGMVLSGGVVLNSTGTAAALGQWNHVAWVRSGSSVAIFVNGTRQATATSSTNGSVCTRIGDIGGGAGYFPIGYISNARIVIGSSVYNPASTTITVPTSPLTAISGTQLLTCQNSIVKDNSTNNYAITVNGNVAVQPFSPFTRAAAYGSTTNSGSAYFDGTGDYLTVPNNAVLNLGSSNFTMEAWIYLTAVGARATIIGKLSSGGSATDSSYGFEVNASNKLYGYVSNGTAYAGATGATSLVANVWYHAAFVRNGNTFTVYLNGVSDGTTTITTAVNTSTASVGVGRPGDYNGYYFTGFNSNVRLVVGTAVYTGNFTPPTSPLTAIANTSLLFSYVNGGIFDNATTATFETAGNAQISTAQKKFGTGSLAFDGTGDYLVPSGNNINLAFESNDWTIEFWLYLSSNQSSIIYDGRPSGGTGITPAIYTNTNELRYAVNGVDRILAGSALVSATWYHVAVCRGSGTTRMFVNGTQVGSSYADSNVYVNSTGRPIIGASGNSLGTSALNGYIDDLRITKGIARYTANFSIPTAAFPNR